MADYYHDNKATEIFVQFSRNFYGEIKKFGIIHGTHIFVFAAGVFLTPHTPKDYHTKFGTFVRCVTILPLVYSTITTGVQYHWNLR